MWTLAYQCIGNGEEGFIIIGERQYDGATVTTTVATMTPLGYLRKCMLFNCKEMCGGKLNQRQ